MNSSNVIPGMACRLPSLSFRTYTFGSTSLGSAWSALGLAEDDSAGADSAGPVGSWAREKLTTAANSRTATQAGRRRPDCQSRCPMAKTPLNSGLQSWVRQNALRNEKADV